MNIFDLKHDYKKIIWLSILCEKKIWLQLVCEKKNPALNIRWKNNLLKTTLPAPPQIMKWSLPYNTEKWRLMCAPYNGTTVIFLQFCVRQIESFDFTSSVRSGGLSVGHSTPGSQLLWVWSKSSIVLAVLLVCITLCRPHHFLSLGTI